VRQGTKEFGFLIILGGTRERGAGGEKEKELYWRDKEVSWRDGTCWIGNPFLKGLGSEEGSSIKYLKWSLRRSVMKNESANTDASRVLFDEGGEKI